MSFCARIIKYYYSFSFINNATRQNPGDNLIGIRVIGCDKTEKEEDEEARTLT